MENNNQVIEETKQIQNNESTTVDINGLDDMHENEIEYENALNKVNELNLNWTHRSVEYIVHKRNITFNQLRNCMYRIGDTKDVGYDLYKSCNYIIQAGLVGSKQVKETDLALLDEKARDIIDDWRETVGFIGILHIILINIMEKKHFFMDTRGIKIIQYLSSKNLQEDLVNKTMIEDLQMKMHQTQAVSMD